MFHNIQWPDILSIEPWSCWKGVDYIIHPQVIYDHIYNLHKISPTTPSIIISTYNGDGGLYFADHCYMVGSSLKIDAMFLIPENIVHVFSTNVAVHKDPLITVLPYGIFDNRPYLSQDIADAIFVKPCAKDILCYARFSTWTLPRARSMIRAWCEAQPFIHSDFSDRPQEQTQQTLDNYFVNLHRSKFVICPPGNGPDTLRVYEALYAGAIPIMLDNYLHRNFLDLPIVLVPSFEAITQERLEEVYDKAISLDWNFDKLKLSYYNNLFNQGI